MRFFWRIFASFWLAFLTMIGLTTVILSSSTPLRIDKIRNLPLASLQTCALRDSDRFHGSIGSSSATEEMNCYGGIFLPGGKLPSAAPSGHPVLSKEELRVVEDAESDSGVTIQALRTKTYVAFHVRDGHASDIYLAQIPVKSNAFAVVVSKRIARLIVISGLLGYLMALYFSHPITRLSHTADRFGNGDLSARVATALSLRTDEFGELSRSFNQMADRIETLLARYKSFLSDASHELGSPLTRLNIALALASRNASPEVRRDIDRIKLESDKLNALVRKLLLLARLESKNEFANLPEPLAIESILGEVCADAAMEADELQKSIMICRREPFIVSGDSDLLRSAFDNILRNGLRFARVGGAVQVSFFRIPSTSVGVVQIDDDGPGIPAGAEQRIFEPFVRLFNQTPGANDGSGLGLSIARRAVIASGGQISASNLERGGLRVTVELPCATSGSLDSKVHAAQSGGV